MAKGKSLTYTVHVLPYSEKRLTIEEYYKPDTRAVCGRMRKETNELEIEIFSEVQELLKHPLQRDEILCPKCAKNEDFIMRALASFKK